MSTYRALWLNPELHEELRVYCRRNNVKIGTLTKEIVQKYLEQNKRVEETREVEL